MEKSLQHPRFVSSSPASLNSHPPREREMGALVWGFFINRIRKCEDRATKPTLENWGGGDVNQTKTYNQLSRRLQFNKSSISFPAPFLHRLESCLASSEYLRNFDSAEAAAGEEAGGGVSEDGLGGGGGGESASLSLCW